MAAGVEEAGFELSEDVELELAPLESPDDLLSLLSLLSLDEAVELSPSFLGPPLPGLFEPPLA